MSDKYLRPGGLKTTDLAAQKFRSYFEKLPEHFDYADVFDPTFWRHHKGLMPFDVIRLARVNGDNDFDIYVTVRRVVAGGVVVDFHGGRPPVGIDPYKAADAALAAAMQIKIAPVNVDGKPVIRTQFTPKTQWRVLGLDNAEVKRDIPSKEAAEVEMANYLDQIRMRNPTDEELAQLAQDRMKVAVPA